jgi:Gas vesicle synthesis protein GvpL/GvpF
MYTYAFLHSDVAHLNLPDGISGSLWLINTAHLSALVEPKLDFEALQQSDNQLMQAVLAHDRVVRDVFRQTEILPLRFGTQFVSEVGILEHLHAHTSEYLDKLAQLTGKAEYTLKFTPIDHPEPVISSDAKGKDYFLAKKQRYQTQLEQQQAQADEIERVKETVAHLYPYVVSVTQDGIERIHLLVSRQDEALLSQQVQAWQLACPHWELIPGEALPPYHFV